MEGEQLLERPGDVRSVPFAQRWAVATAGLGPRPLGPLVRRRQPPGWGEAAATSGGRRGPLGQCTSWPRFPAEFGLRGSGNKGWGWGWGVSGVRPRGKLPLPRLHRDARTLALPFSARQLPSPWPGVTTRGGACVSVYERAEVALVPTCPGRWSAAWPRQGGPPEAAPAARPGLRPRAPCRWAGRWFLTDFDLCSPRPGSPSWSLFSRWAGLSGEDYFPG